MGRRGGRLSRGWFIVFAKAPRPGLVKTRLCPPLSPDQAATFYRAMLGDVLVSSLRFANALDLEPVLAFHPPDGEAELLAETPADYRLHVQRGLDLSDRMANAFAEAGAAGAPLALLRGSDSPVLSFSQVNAALVQLEAGDDLVLTPDLGGGYAMIGMARAAPEVFNVPMSTQDVLSETIAIADSLGLRHSTTNETLDVDRVEDFHALERVPAKELLDSCPRTVEVIAELRKNGVL